MAVCDLQWRDLPIAPLLSMDVDYVNKQIDGWFSVLQSHLVFVSLCVCDCRSCLFIQITFACQPLRLKCAVVHLSISLVSGVLTQNRQHTTLIGASASTSSSLSLAQHTINSRALVPKTHILWRNAKHTSTKHQQHPGDSVEVTNLAKFSTHTVRRGHA